MKKIKNILVILTFIIVPLATFAQDDPSVPPPPFCPTSKDPKMGAAPLEDCIPAILFMAFLYGAFKLNQVRKSKVNTDLLEA